MTIELTQDEFDDLLLALGMATGGLLRVSDRQHYFRLLKLINAVNRNNPDFRPYEIPPEVARGAL